MKLTKSERHTAYIIMLAEVDNIILKPKRYHVGLCWLSYVLDRQFEVLDGTNIHIDQHLPELWEKRPYSPGHGYWFPFTKQGWEKRIKLLQQCIDETYDFEKEEQA